MNKRKNIKEAISSVEDEIEQLTEFKFQLTEKAKNVVKNATEKQFGRPLKGKRPKSESITVRIEPKEKALLIKTYGSISTAIDYLIKKFMKERLK
jgi:predicted RNA-binding protein Jag